MDIGLADHRLERMASQLRGVSPRVALAAVLLVVAILAGQFSLARLFPVSLNWLPQVRWLALAGAAVLVAPDTARNLKTLGSAPLAALAVLGFYLILRSVFDAGGLGVSKSADIVCLLTEALLVAVVARLERGPEVMFATVLACAVLLFGVEFLAHFGLINLGPERYGFGWGGGFGGPITFNRIQFLAFCVVLGLAAAARPQALPVLVFVTVASALFLFATWGSMQKAPFAASLIVLAGLIAAFVLSRDWLMLGVLLASLVLASVMTVAVFGDRLTGRLQNSLKVSSQHEQSLGQGRIQLAELIAPPLRGGRMSDVVPVVEPQGQQQPQGSQATLALRYCYFRSATNPQTRPEDDKDVLCYERTITDFTGRVALAIEAVRGFTAAPVFGHGLGSFKVLFIHPEVPIVADPYVYPHNLLLEIAFEGGLVGLTLLLIAMAVSVWAVLQSDVRNAEKIVAAGFMGFMALSTMVSGDFYDSRLFWLPAMLLPELGRRFGVRHEVL